MARRKKIRSFDRLDVILANTEVAAQGNVAFADTSDGMVYAAVAADRIAIGYFAEDLTGDGAKTLRVQLFEEIWAQGLANDTAPNDVQAGDLFGAVYWKDGASVSTDDATATRPSAGMPIAIDGSTVYVRAPRF